MSIEAILWDFGGVLTTSPFEAFNRYEVEHGLPRDFIRSINATNPESNAWARFESSEIGLDEFDAEFAGHGPRGGFVVAAHHDERQAFGAQCGKVPDSAVLEWIADGEQGAGDVVVSAAFARDGAVE